MMLSPKNVVCSLLACAFVSAIPATATAAQPAKCAKRAQLIKALNEKYHETPRALGLSTSNSMAMEVFASEKGTWTVMMTMTNGLTCIMAAGHSWQTSPAVPAGPET